MVLSITLAAGGCGSALPADGDVGAVARDATVAPADLTISGDQAVPAGDGGTEPDASMLVDLAAPADAAMVVDLAAAMDAAAMVNAEGGTFACGPMVTCKLASDYCFSSNLGDAGMTGWSCTPLGNCAMGDPCMCLQFQHQCIIGCSNSNGAIHIWCPK